MFYLNKSMLQHHDYIVIRNFLHSNYHYIDKFLYHLLNNNFLLFLIKQNRNINLLFDLSRKKLLSLQRLFLQVNILGNESSYSQNFP